MNRVEKESKITEFRDTKPMYCFLRVWVKNEKCRNAMHRVGMIGRLNIQRSGKKQLLVFKF
jgi:hypothetical protein